MLASWNDAQAQLEGNLLDVAAGIVARENDSALKALALNHITTGAKTLQTGQYEPAQSS